MINIKAAINEQARDEERRKIAIENRFVPSIRGLFRQMLKDFENLYIATGTIIDFNVFIDEWRGALKRQYQRVGRDFTNNVRKSEFVRDLVIKQDEEVSLEDVAIIGAAFSIFSAARAETQSAFIVNTSNNDAFQSVQNALTDLRSEDPFREPTNEDVAKEASRSLRRSFNGRVGTIANMETQAPAEQAKLIEASVLSGLAVLPFQTVTELPRRATKTWATVGDERVRIAHANADFQKRNIEQPFTVKGQSLKHPGDTSLGATIDNVANCRCSSIFDNT